MTVEEDLARFNEQVERILTLPRDEALWEMSDIILTNNPRGLVGKSEPFDRFMKKYAAFIFSEEGHAFIEKCRADRKKVRGQ